VAGACTAVFGRKDYQQLKVIERMTRDLMLPVRIVPHPTVREADGLALSSRNVYLDADERPRARAIPRALSRAVQAFATGERSCRALREPVAETLGAAGFRPDYVTIAHAEELRPWADDATLPERALLAVAAFMGTTRLIDNVVLGEDPPPNAEA
jgi:pantoate--beta-alanine ligase